MRKLRRSLKNDRASARVRVPLGPRSYDIQIGSGIVRRMGEFLATGGPKRAFIISDQRLKDARRSLLGSLIRAGWDAHEIPVRAGEPLKDIQAVYPLYGKLLRAGASRDATLFALGGGSVGDAAGFVAATYLRGIRWVGVPTTLLAQVDSSVGGKTAINHEAGKNLIGAFHQPSLVVCDTDFLRTLSRREVVSGFGETVKYALIYDPAFLRFLEARRDAFFALDPSALSRSIEQGIRWKARAVARDELDRTGIREALNFGHTFGHALEGATGYGFYQHGEAVIWGMRFALALSLVRNHLSEHAREPLDRLLRSLEVPPLPRGFDSRRLFALMKKDKKVRDGKIHFVLLKKPGRTVTDNGVTERDLADACALIRPLPKRRSSR